MPAIAAASAPQISEQHMLAQDIRALRKARGLTLAEAALKLGRSIGWLSQVERGISIPSIEDMRLFAALFGVPLGLFFTHEVPDEAERGIVVRAGRRRSLGTAESGLVEELLSPDLGGSFELLRSVFAPGAALQAVALQADRGSRLRRVRQLRPRGRRRLAPSRRRRQLPLQGKAVPLAESRRRAGGRHLGGFAAGLLRV